MTSTPAVAVTNSTIINATTLTKDSVRSLTPKPVTEMSTVPQNEQKIRNPSRLTEGAQLQDKTDKQSTLSARSTAMPDSQQEGRT